MQAVNVGRQQWSTKQSVRLTEAFKGVSLNDVQLNEGGTVSSFWCKPGMQRTGFWATHQPCSHAKK